jgi:hypothetical protein
VFTGSPLISTLKIAGYTRHDLLCFGWVGMFDAGQKFLRIWPAEIRDLPTIPRNKYLPVFGDPVCEAQIALF